LFESTRKLLLFCHENILHQNCFKCHTYFLTAPKNEKATPMGGLLKLKVDRCR
jgi:hypothetical protein